MTTKTKNALKGIGLILGTLIFAFFYLYDWIVLLIPQTKFYLLKIKETLYIIAGGAILFSFAPLYNWYQARKIKNHIHSPKEGSVLIARDKNNQPIYLTPDERTQHLHIVGTTGTGKTQLTLNMMFQDIEQGKGFLLIEHKSDHQLLAQLKAKIKKESRNRDFHLFSLIDPQNSHSYNPLLEGSPKSIADRIFRSFEISHEFYKKVQLEWLSKAIELLSEVNEPINFLLLYQCLTNRSKLENFIEKHQKCYGETSISNFFENHLDQKKDYIQESFKGLEVHLSQFISGRFSKLLNSFEPRISIGDALYYNKIVYFQLPTMEDRETAVAIGKMVLQDFQSAVSKRQTQNENGDFYSCFLDEFSSIAYPEFTELISKARSANVGLVLSHQSLGDLTKVSPDFSNTILTNTNIKAIFRCPNPETAEYFGKSFGTQKAIHHTEQTESKITGTNPTGLGSQRVVDEFIAHPEVIKKFPRGQGVISIATDFEIKIEHCHFLQPSRLNILQKQN